MTTISVKVNGSNIIASTDGKLTSGMVGIPVSVEYDSEWNGLIKTASFRVGKFVRSRENIGTATTVPWEVMRYSGKPLEVGIQGKDADGNIVMPTVWEVISTIYSGANASVPGAPNPDSGEIPSSGGASIDDSVIAIDKTWSSKKISQEIANAGGGEISQSDYRHIFTYEHTADEGVKQIDITKNKDGDAFACSDFLIYLTLPTSADIETNYKTQLYIGSTLDFYELQMPQAFNRTKKRRMRVHLYHVFDGYWVADGVYNDNESQPTNYVPDINSANSAFGSLKSNTPTGKTISTLYIKTNADIPSGAVFEIYGK